MIKESVIENMNDGKEKELMKILKESGKPFEKKIDGYAVLCKEAKKITFNDYEGVENTLEVPEGSYVVCNDDSTYPKIVTADEFKSTNKFIEGKKEKDNPEPKDEKPKTGMDSMDY